VKVTLGPIVPTRDGSWRPLPSPADVRGLEIEPLEDLARADALVAKRIEELELPTYPIDPPDAYVTVHEDDSGKARLVFVMNPTNESIVAKVGVAGPASLASIIGDSVAYARTSGGFELTIPARTVRIFSASHH
jgi:beta-galactosidase